MALDSTTAMTHFEKRQEDIENKRWENKLQIEVDTDTGIETYE